MVDRRGRCPYQERVDAQGRTRATKHASIIQPTTNANADHHTEKNGSAGPARRPLTSHFSNRTPPSSPIALHIRSAQHAECVSHDQISRLGQGGQQQQQKRGEREGARIRLLTEPLCPSSSPCDSLRAETTSVNSSTKAFLLSAQTRTEREICRD
jgi:hypothetical protein